VNSGAAVGFLPPLSTRMAEDYWGEVIRELAQGTRILLVASEENVVTGAVQLALVTRPNSLHRAEVQKLFVHTSFRQRGIAQALMKALEEAAMSEGRKLLVLDTRRGDAAEQLYLKLGYTRAGIIPRYARSADGTLHDTVVFYRVLDDEL
jgi:ribosomal protein S18 acetylase RimI-like enzyme